MCVDKVLVGLLLSLGIVYCSSEHQENPVVTVKQGKLRGSIRSMLDGTSYYSFKGVPYAQPPVGELRFRAPLQPKAWEGIKNAINHSPNCPQYDTSTTELVEGSEDCLALNVYTKTLRPNAKLPVMVYVHGGSFMSGSGDNDMHGPEFLLQHDVIIVTINYRLEVLGFLSLDTPEVPGNAGMKDQVAALRWVKENIAQFGGNSDDVTLFGESSGAAAVTYHMLSPMSKGLFHKVIAQSGVCLQDWAVGVNAKSRAFRAAKTLGKDTKDRKELLDFLRSVPAIDLANMTDKTMTDDEKYRGLPMHFVPVVEKKFDNTEAFLSEHPIVILSSGEFNRVPFFVGYNSAEGLLMLEDQLKKASILNKNLHYLVPREIAQKVSSEKSEEFGRRISSFYMGDKGISNDTAEGIVNMQTDLYFSYQTHRFIHFYSRYAPVYMYRFNYVTGMNVIKNLLGLQHMNGACHADDVFYLFYSEFNKEPYETDAKSRQIVYRLTKFWTDYARTSNPTPTPSDVTWPQYSSSHKEYMALQQPPTPALYADKDRIEFWNKLYCEAGLPCIIQS